MRVHSLAALLAAALLAPAAPAVAAPGDLDSTFGQNGMLLTNFGRGESAAFGVAIQPDGKIVTAGTSNYEAETGNYLGEFALSRHNADGSLDGSFGSGGLQFTSFGPTTGAYAQAVALQADGKIVVAGYRRVADVDVEVDFAVVRYRADGSPDPSFSGDGKLTLDFGSYDAATAVAIQADGKILVAGGGVIARLNADGSLDPGFSGDGKVFMDLAVMAMAIQPDGRIVVAGGYGFRLARFLADGSPDGSFAGGGTATTDLPGLYYARALALGADGRIVVAGGAQSELGDLDFALVRYRGDGGLDTSFGTGGLQTTGDADADDFAAGVTIQANGKIVVAGQSASRDWTSEIPSRVLLARFGTSGAPDSSFGTGGSVTSSIGFSSHATAIALQPNGRIVLAGIGTTFDAGSSMLLARYHGDTPAANVAPIARFTRSCSGLNCYLAAHTSSDPDGPIAGYRWDFSDGTSATGSYVIKTFAHYGNYGATLTVTDGPGATGTQAQTLALLRLTATGSLVGGLPTAQLSWNGTPGTTYWVYRGSKRVAVTTASTLSDRPPVAASGSYSYAVCEASGPYCSATETFRIP